MGNFIGMVYSQLKEAGVDTSDMDTSEAIDKWNAMQEKEGKFGSDKPTDAESKRMKEMGIEDEKKSKYQSAFDSMFGGTTPEDFDKMSTEHVEKIKKDQEELEKVKKEKEPNEEKANSKYLTEKEKDEFIENEYDKDINTEVNSWDDEFKSKMLGRMVADVDYWINTGKTEGGYKHLWAKDPKAQAKYMEKIFNSMNSDDIDLTREDLEYYKKELLSK